MLFKRFLLLPLLLILPLAQGATVTSSGSSTDRAIPTWSGSVGAIIQDNANSASNNVAISPYGDIYWPAGFGYLYLHSMSTTLRDARPPASGMIFFNSTLGLPQYYGNGGWHTWIDDGNVPANMFYAGPYQPLGTNGTGQATFRYIFQNDIGGTDVMYVPQGTGFARIINHGEQATASLIFTNDLATNGAAVNDTFVFNGTAWVFGAGAGGMTASGSNNVTGTLRITGSYQYGWTDLGSSTNLTGATNALFKILTGNLVLTNSIRDNENVRLQVTQDATGSRTLQIDNVSAWLDNTNQSSTMPGINTNGGRFSIVDVWRVNGTNYGTVNTSPSVYSAALNTLSPASTGGKILGLNTNSATPSFLDVAPGSYISNGVVYAGTSFSVGTTNVTSPVLSGTTPSAPTNGKLIGWQTSGGNISGAIVGDGNSGHFLDGTGAFSAPAGGGTVTATGGALTANSVVLGAGTTDTKVVAGIVTDGTAQLTLGEAGVSVGKINFKNQTSGTITVTAPTGALGNPVLTLPITTGTLALTSQITGGTNSGPIALTYSTTNVAINAATPAGCITNAPLTYRLTLTGDTFFQNPTGAGDGQVITIEAIQDVTGNRVATLDTKFALGSDITAPFTLTTNANKRDFFTARYNSTADRWFLTGFVRGY